MNLTNERKRAAQAKTLGESASAEALPELAELTCSESPLVRRLAASALGKLAGIVDSVASVDWLQYQQEGKRLISLNAQDKPRLEALLEEKLKRYARLQTGRTAGQGESTA